MLYINITMNTIPSVSRFKNKTPTQSLASSYDITEVNNKIDIQSIISNENYFPKYNNITPSFDTDSYEVNSDDDVYELPNITSCTIKPLKSSRILSKQLATSFKTIEVNNSETNISTSNAIEADSSEVNNDNNSSELFISNKIRSLKSSRHSTQLSASSSKTINQINQPLSLVAQNKNNTSNYLKNDYYEIR
ncbi:1614_t:CDS:2 [Cetraspora pellucida]|uniref:1614_t:CDS:1 n=1 Tax=Cetraspora pellucida TaxID=1433469 RepID=A0A9N9BHV3_9GLOM|nr:1614_t:CDS:2 [Cetraspora pellucida]